MSVEQLKSIAEEPTITTDILMSSLAVLGIALAFVLIRLRVKRED